MFNNNKISLFLFSKLCFSLICNNKNLLHLNRFDFFLRFSLLLLEPGEIYFEDYSCFCHPGKTEREAFIK